MTQHCLREAEEIGLILKVLRVSKALDEDAGFLDGSLDREFQVAYDPADVLEEVALKPTEFDHATHC